MVEGGWSFVWAAYAVSVGAFVALTLVVWGRLAHWARAARELEKR